MKKIINKSIVYKIIWLVSFAIYVLFTIKMIKLDMIPTKYMLLIIIPFTLIYLFTSIFIFLRKFKLKAKIITSIFMILFGILFSIGIKYLGVTSNFVNTIDNDLIQKDTYYVMVIKSSNYKALKDLKGKKIALYKTNNSDKAFKKIDAKYNIEKVDYTDIDSMINDLKNDSVSSILTNDSLNEALKDELSASNVELKCIKKISVTIKKKDIVKVVDVTKKKFNIYIAGGDALGDIGKVTNTDVNMIASVDPINNKILLTSIPRDYYVNLPSFNAYDKLTHAGYYGIEESVKTIENLLDIDINYYVKVNFSTVIGVVDAIGGIDVNSDFAFRSNTNEQGKSYSYVVGNNNLNGEKALAFARERHAFEDGDVQRVKNQQKVITAIIDKVSSSTALITNFSSILDSVKRSLSTNMEAKSINKFVKKQLNDMKGWTIESQNLVGINSSSRETYSLPGMDLYVMEQDSESVKGASDKIKEFMK